jgi:hypothetical protein
VVLGGGKVGGDGRGEGREGEAGGPFLVTVSDSFITYPLSGVYNEI